LKASFMAQSPKGGKGEDAMKRKRFSVEQIVAVLKQAELGMPVADLIRKVGITEQAFYRWEKVYKSLESEQVRKLKQLQEENTRLKGVVADLNLDKVMLLSRGRLNPPSRWLRRQKAVVTRREGVNATRPNEVWSLDFVADQFSDGHHFLALTVLDVFTRECLAIKAGMRLRG